jgi:hypothetical protein
VLRFKETDSRSSRILNGCGALAVAASASRFGTSVSRSILSRDSEFTRPRVDLQPQGLARA